jgi:hypothetical protein
MGLMNIGRSEGTQVIQLFGRGVRLLGKGRKLKRSSHLPGDHPANLAVLETLNIFGVRASYMAAFRDYLDKEGIPTDEGAAVSAVRSNAEATHREHLPRDEVLSLEVDEHAVPEVNVMPLVEAELSTELQPEQPARTAGADNRQLPEKYVRFFDWQRIFRDLWRFRLEQNYNNLVFRPAVLQTIIEEGYYRLYCPEQRLQVHSFTEIRDLEKLAVTILKQYMVNYYRLYCTRML